MQKLRDGVKKGKNKTKKQIDFDIEEEGDVPEESEEEIIEEEESESTDEIDGSSGEEAASEEQSLRQFWKYLSIGKEENLINKCYGAIWESSKGKKKKQGLYVGKMLHRFREDVGGKITGFELDCLEAPLGETTILKSVPRHLGKDIDIFPAWNIIQAVQIEPLKGGQWNVPNYGLLKERFRNVVTIDREALYSDIKYYKKNPTRISSRYKSSCVFRTLQKIKMDIFLKIITILTRQLCSVKSPS